MIIGILDIQGAVSEHEVAFERAFMSKNMKGATKLVKTLDDLKDIDGLALPGGESSAISAQLARLGMDKEIHRMVEQGFPIMGTCAGTILLAKRLITDMDEEITVPLGLMDITVKRNAFGRQKESFEHYIEIKNMDEPYGAVFIRAPMINEVGEGVESLAMLNDEIVIARQSNMLAMVFHPELTMDTRIHEMFIDIVLEI